MLLESAGLSVETEASGIDERTIEMSVVPQDPCCIAQQLAREKALAVSRRHPDRVVIGADQMLACDDRLFHKPADRAAAQEQLAALSGRTHVLNSATAVARQGHIVREVGEVARLTMRTLSRDDIDAYLDVAHDSALHSVGASQVEGVGIHLFDSIEGDHSSILGIPLLPLLAALREMKLLAL
jgi:septum formation protein